MSKRKPMDKAQVRERRNRLLESAAAAELSLTEGVREMRAIAGMTQEQFARHRGVSARVIKSIELGQGNPTVVTMNRIGLFFGLEVAFVPVRRNMQAADQPQPADDRISAWSDAADASVDALREAVEAREGLAAHMRKLNDMVSKLDSQIGKVTRMRNALVDETDSPCAPARVKHHVPKDNTAGKAGTSTKRKPRAP